jgi:hypothetical protein
MTRLYARSVTPMSIYQSKAQGLLVDSQQRWQLLRLQSQQIHECSIRASGYLVSRQHQLLQALVATCTAKCVQLVVAVATQLRLHLCQRSLAAKITPAVQTEMCTRCRQAICPGCSIQKCTGPGQVGGSRLAV